MGYTNDEIRQRILDFLEGRTEIVAFKEDMDAHGEMYDYLQEIIDTIKARRGSITPCPLPFPANENGVALSTEGIGYLLKPEEDPSLAYCPPRYESVRQLLNYAFRMVTHDVATASGALRFYNETLVIFCQCWPEVHPTARYIEAFDFALEVIPEYLSGGEAEGYIQREILPQYPETMKKTARKKAVRAKIREEFKSEKGYPCWVQSSDWPMGADGKPMTYVKKGKTQGSKYSWLFRDESNGELRVVEQYD